MMKRFLKDKVIKTKSEILPKRGDISKLLLAEKQLLVGRVVEIDNTLAMFKEHPNLEKTVEIILKPLEVEE